jgi:hypothetical protein
MSPCSPKQNEHRDKILKRIPFKENVPVLPPAKLGLGAVAALDFEDYIPTNACFACNLRGAHAVG